MPITTQFSKRFYETLSHEVADELVAWFNQVDASYRTEFSELFKLHFDRFNDRLEREIGGLRSELQREVGGLRSEMQGRFEAMEGRFEAFQAKVEQRIAAAEVRLIRWMFVFWIGSIGTMIALNQF
ncbi:MAG: hypothetical protein HY599_06645 [Candidatus Omnitrophica bacterium]|nr:hypothetical protein [Candidatus Omnitrophota bacterium]